MKKSLHHSTIITLLFLLLLSVTACKDTDELPDETPTVPDTDIAVVQDTAVKPTGGKASECQPGQDIDNTWDGKFSSDGGVPYHSVWNQSATTSQSSFAIDLRACLALGVECAGFMPQQK